MSKSPPSDEKIANKTTYRQKISVGRLCLFGGAVAALVAFVSFSFFGEDAITPKTTAPQPSSAGPLDGKTDRPFIEAVRLTPAQPSKLDTLKAEIVGPGPNGGLTYTYVWKANGRVLEAATKDTLELASMKKRDLITVTVTPHGGGTAGHPVESPIVAVHSAPPTLELKPLAQNQRAGASLEMQLISQDPDGDDVTFSLEAPFVPGMSIDSRSGRVTWVIRPDQKGTIHFGAAAEDTDKTKVSKIFDVTVQ